MVALLPLRVGRREAKSRITTKELKWLSANKGFTAVDSKQIRYVENASKHASERGSGSVAL